MKALRINAKAVLCIAALLLAAGCGERDPVWDTVLPQPIVTKALTKGAAIVDAPANRVMVLSVAEELSLEPRSFAIGSGFATAATTADHQRLLVLCRGVVPRRSEGDERPALTVIDTEPDLHVSRIYALAQPMSGMIVDPEGKYAIVHPTSADAGFLQNPNQLIFVDLERGPDELGNPYAMTLRSFGGKPQGFTFTQLLDLPGGQRRLLIVLTDRDVSLIDLKDLTIPEVTVQLTGSTDTLVPAGIAVSDGEPGVDDDARIAIMLEDEPNVVLVDLTSVPPEQSAALPQSFLAMPNVVHVGGVASDISFVRTDGGLRLAALIPSKQEVTLVDPATGMASQIALGNAFERISIVTGVVGTTAAGSDTALLWSSSSNVVALLALGSTVGKPYQSVDLLTLPAPVSQVYDVPAPNQHLKLLLPPLGLEVTVLDLLERTAAPITSASSSLAVQTAPDGGRTWFWKNQDLAMLNMQTLEPLNVHLSHPVHAVADVLRSDGGRALVAVHAVGAVGATVLDAYQPSLAGSQEYVGLLMGELQ